MPPMKHWTLDDIPWESFDASKVDPDILRLIKAASMVEQNGLDYAVYLHNVFADDPEFRAVVDTWAREEVQHGQALGKWAMLADPTFDFEGSFKRFHEGYKLPLDATASVRGSRAGELMARCIVETGTSSYYAALRDAVEEPALKAICAKISADELRHYKLFYGHMKRWLAREKLGTWGRLRIGLGRIFETEDDELAYAYYVANGDSPTYDRKSNTQAHALRAYRVYRRNHIERALAMAFKAVGLKPHGWLNRTVTRLACWFQRRRIAKLELLVGAG